MQISINPLPKTCESIRCMLCGDKSSCSMSVSDENVSVNIVVCSECAKMGPSEAVDIVLRRGIK